MRRLRRKNAGIRIVRERSAQILGSARNAEVRRRLGGYMGTAWSARANDALERGLRPAPMIAEELGVSAEAVEVHMHSPEWHHVGEDYEEVSFYDPDEAPLTDADGVVDEETAQSLLTYVDMVNYDTRTFTVEPRRQGFSKPEAGNKAYSLFTSRSTAVAKDAFAAAEELRNLIDGGETSAETLREAAKKALDAAEKGRVATKEAVKAFLAENSDWRAKRPRRARRGANGLRYSMAEAFPSTAEERAQIETAAKANGTWLKAPNGADTKLTPAQWVAVRTKAFKEWFGDWEKNARIKKLIEAPSISLSEYTGQYELTRDAARSWIKNNIEGKSFTIDDTGDVVRIGKAGRKKVTSHGYDSEVHLKSIASIPAMLKNSTFIEESSNEKAGGRYVRYRYYVVGVKMDGVDYTAKLVVGVASDGSLYYDHSLTQMEKGVLSSLALENQPRTQDNQNALDGVKDTRLLSLLQAENSSKVVDENGEPLVVWHGTREHFYEFEHGRAFGSGDIYGYLGDAFYATNDYETAESYADGGYKRTLGLFLNIRNPYETKNPDHTSPAHGGSFAKHLGVSPREVSPTLRQMGHDGVIATDEEAGYIEYAFYHSTQAKSATDNVGTYDAGNPDIRFQIGNKRKEQMRARLNTKLANGLRYSLEEAFPATEAERAEIEREAKAKGTWLKAPNGQDTELTPKQWVTVRTAAFKKWFGDWEKDARIEKLRRSEPLVFTGEEYKGKYELDARSAERYILDNLRGEYVNKDTGERISVSRRGVRKVLHHDVENEVHLKSIAYIPQMLENAVFVSEELNAKSTTGFDSYRYYVCGLEIGGEQYTAKLVVGKLGRETYYDHVLSPIKKDTLLKGIGEIPSPRAQKKSISTEIRDKRLLSILQTNSSKIVDGNGEPLVVYHGTDADFTVFDRAKTRATMDIQGNFFSP